MGTRWLGLSLTVIIPIRGLVLFDSTLYNRFPTPGGDLSVTQQQQYSTSSFDVFQSPNVSIKLNFKYNF